MKSIPLNREANSFTLAFIFPVSASLSFLNLLKLSFSFAYDYSTLFFNAVIEFNTSIFLELYRSMLPNLFLPNIYTNKQISEPEERIYYKRSAACFTERLKRAKLTISVGYTLIDSNNVRAYSIRFRQRKAVSSGSNAKKALSVCLGAPTMFLLSSA